MSPIPMSPTQVGFYDKITGEEHYTYDPFDKTSVEYNANGMNIIIDGTKKDVEIAQKLLNKYKSEPTEKKCKENEIKYNPYFGFMYNPLNNTSTMYSGHGITVVLTGKYKDVMRAKSALELNGSEADKVVEELKVNTEAATGYKYIPYKGRHVLVLPDGTKILGSSLLLFEKNSNDNDNPYIILTEREGKYKDTGDFIDTKLPANEETALISASKLLEKRTNELFKTCNKNIKYVDIPTKDGLVYHRCYYVVLDPIRHNLNYMFKRNKKKSDTKNMARFCLKSINDDTTIHGRIKLFVKELQKGNLINSASTTSFKEETELGNLVASPIQNGMRLKNVNMTVASGYHITF